MENNENKDWYPMVWKKAWYISEYPTVIEALVTRYVSADDTYALSSNKAFGKVYRSKSELFPTAEAALASIRVYDLEGKEVLIPPRPLVLEPKPLEWHHREMNEEAVVVDGDWSFYAWNNGDWSIYCDGVDGALKWGNENPDLDFDTAKAAIHEWRVNHLKSMLP